MWLDAALTGQQLWRCLPLPEWWAPFPWVQQPISSPSRICAQGPAYHPAHENCKKGCCFFRKPKAVATNARVLHTACKRTCQRAFSLPQAGGTMLYFYLKTLFICRYARKRQKSAVIYNPAHLLVIKCGCNTRSTKPQAIQHVHKWGCGTECEMWRGSVCAEGVSREPWWTQSQHCPQQIHRFHIQVAWAGLGWAPHPFSSANQQPSGSIKLGGWCRVSVLSCLPRKTRFVPVPTTNKKWSFNTSSLVKWSQSPQVRGIQYTLPHRVERSFGEAAPYHKPSYCLLFECKQINDESAFYECFFSSLRRPSPMSCFKTDGATSVAATVPLARF